MSHVCEHRLYWEEYYAAYVPDGWPPQCRHCGRFMKWTPLPVADEFKTLVVPSQSDAKVTQGD